ncbi:MAG: glycosyltransferase, partial [Lachnospiraceae bacterium]|nr:glycosyltransferase [Lachnospiraceae bacterium]
MSKLSVVVPTFNESENVGNLVNQVDYALKGIDYEIIFVDDSTDNTPDVIEQVMKENANVRMKHREGETGLATAVIEGFR